MLPTVRRRVAWLIGLIVTAAAVAIIVPSVDAEALRRAATTAFAHPLTLVAVLAVYGGAFLLRAWAWRRLLPGTSLGHAAAAIHVSLAGNHLLPLRLGEVLRVTSLVRRTDTPVTAATATTVTLRAADIGALGVIALLTGPALAWQVAGPWGAGAAVVGLLVAAAGAVWLWRSDRHGEWQRAPGPAVLSATLVAWLLEAVVIYQAAAWAGLELGAREAVLVTAVTVAAQVAALAPGGFGTYEAAGTASLVALGADPGTALAVALTAHAVKTAYALAGGAIAALVPSPTLFGRLRLPARRTAAATEQAPDGPVVLFLPAHNEETTVASVVARAPRTVQGRPVEVIVVDDGSTDATAGRAAEAGATVERFDRNRGLGAAVRRGFELGVDRCAAAVAFCDADGEYAPEELDRMVAPILDGTADYVVGSRFEGDIERMLPHRRFGNLTLTWLLRFVARAPISDGQSGYRALSAAAAADAEVIHDFNYAQVLTLDLLAKGYRYREVPISYRFREHGRSFVRLGRYLRAVVPAVWRELQEEPATG
ncbi:MAG: lysylphosphatidylglycerol synthase domain-containing protein [Nitriliruptorales bacterium]|nr:lysylphosphatidylglycerol synthase domain-containing protein [Nitriliruptorales bacterium]